MKRLLAVHVVLWVLGGALLRIAVVPAEVCPPVDAVDARSAAAAAGDWLQRNLGGDGRFVYGYDRTDGRVNPDYSLVRHAGAVVSLYQLVASGEERFLATAERGLGYLLERRVDHDEWIAIGDPGDRVRVGVVGFAVIALLAQRDLSGSTDSDELLRGLGRFLVSQQEPNGAIAAFWDRRTEAAVAGSYGPFATGEAMWALVALDNAFPGEGWWGHADLTLRYLASGDRERSEGYLARLPDHWAAYALEAAGPERLDSELIAYARRLAGYFSLRLRVEAQRTGEGLNLWMRWHPGPPSGVGTSGEGMAALWRLAQQEPRLVDLADDMADRMSCAAGLMVDRQIGASDVTGSEPRLEIGAWFYRSYTQVDDQQHVISALLGAGDAIQHTREMDS